MASCYELCAKKKSGVTCSAFIIHLGSLALFAPLYINSTPPCTRVHLCTSFGVNFIVVRHCDRLIMLVNQALQVKLQVNAVAFSFPLVWAIF